MAYKYAALRAVDGIMRVIPAPKKPSLYCGCILWLSPGLWQSVYYRYETSTGRAIKANLRSGDVFWEGANIGFFSAFALSLGAKVTAFEPAQAIFNRLVKNCPEVKCVRCGVGKQNGSASFFAQGLSSAGSFHREVTAINFSYQPNDPIITETVSVKTIDQLARQFGVPDVVKIDVEGHEADVLAGALRIMASTPPVFIIEIHPPQLEIAGSSAACVYDLLRGHRYEWIDN
jgi:FkbM family methyltransferase